MNSGNKKSLPFPKQKGQKLYRDLMDIISFNEQ